LATATTVQNYTILYYTILYYTILYYTILYYTILYYTILYYTKLYWTILQCNKLSYVPYYATQNFSTRYYNSQYKEINSYHQILITVQQKSCCTISFHENVFMNKHQLCNFLDYSSLMLELQKQCRRTDRRKSLYISKETQQASSYWSEISASTLKNKISFQLWHYFLKFPSQNFEISFQFPSTLRPTNLS